MLYPKLPELVKEIRKRKAISFIVTNGQNPEMIKKLEKQNALPTQLTVSMNASNKELFQRWHNSKNRDAWEKFNLSLEMIRNLKGKTRRAIRLTLVKGYNIKDNKNKLDKISNMLDEHVKQYSNLINKANPDFIHVKGFKSLGYSRERLGYEKQPFHVDVRKFTTKLLKELQKTDKNWRVAGQVSRSCVFLLSRRKKEELKIKKNEF